VLTLASTIHNQKGVLVMEGEQKYLIKKRPREEASNPQSRP
jgi:hypothetical protein